MHFIEILHFLPILLIVITLAAFKFDFRIKSVSLSVLFLSTIGLFFGSHVHHGHVENITLFDPCVSYAVSSVISVFVLTKGILKTQKA
jgi:hypothetical protein